MFAYIRTLADDVCQTLVVGYTTFTKSAAESTKDFKAGYNSVTVESTIQVQREMLREAQEARRAHNHKTSKDSKVKQTKEYQESSATDKKLGEVINSIKSDIAESQRIINIVGSCKCSTAFKVGRWMRNPLINTWKFVKSLWVNSSTTQKIISAVAVCAFGAFMAAAINVLGFSLLATTTLTAAASIGFSRAVFIKHKISWYVECLVDVTIFVAYTMFLMA
jgi:23S rRNA maturation mini-RNase III